MERHSKRLSSNLLVGSGCSMTQYHCNYSTSTPSSIIHRYFNSYSCFCVFVCIIALIHVTYSLKKTLGLLHRLWGTKASDVSLTDGDETDQCKPKFGAQFEDMLSFIQYTSLTNIIILNHPNININVPFPQKSIFSLTAWRHDLFTTQLLWLGRYKF